VAGAAGALRGEACAALVAAGQRFRAVAARDAGDARALANWGRALCLRAELADDPEVRGRAAPRGRPGCRLIFLPPPSPDVSFADPSLSSECPRRAAQRPR